MTRNKHIAAKGSGVATGNWSAIEPSASRTDLLQEWHQLYGHPPPPRLSTRLLRLSVAYQRQARAYGGLDARTRKRLLALARSKGRTDEATPVTTKCSRVTSGARLVREWRGRPHVVDVLDHGILYEGRTYRSLSEVARVITGARWSGPRFFGL